MVIIDVESLSLLPPGWWWWIDKHLVFGCLSALKSLGVFVERRQSYGAATSTNPNKRPDKVLQMPFGVADWKRNEGYIEEFEHTGEIPDYAPITIQNATFHVTINNYNDKSQHVEVKLDASVLEDVKNPYYKKWLREKMEKQAEQVTLDAVADTPDKTKP